MKHRFLCDYLLSFCMAGAFAGCGEPDAQSWNVSPPLQSTGKPSQESLKQAISGSFTGSYAGMASKVGCRKIYYEYYECSQSFAGRGKGTFIGRSRISGGYSCWHGRYRRGHWAGAFTFVSLKHRLDSFDAETLGSGLCFGIPSSYTVTGGTGKFAGATGHLEAHFHVTGHTFTSSWAGILNF